MHFQPCSRSRSPLPLDRSPRFLNSWCTFHSLSFSSEFERWSTCLHFSLSSNQLPVKRHGTTTPGMLSASLREITSDVLSANRILRVRSSSQVKATSLCEFLIVLRPGVVKEPENFRHFEARVFYPRTSGSMCRCYACYGSKEPKEGSPPHDSNSNWPPL